jgi:ElaB/YqjD/DUF883 family membrane-anchored ribosome-binding protein
MTEQAQQTPEQIRAEIERTRRELADTVDALSHKANVKEQARIKKDEVQERVNSNPGPAIAVIGGALLLLLLLRMRKR